MNKILIWGTGEYGNLLYDSIKVNSCKVIGAIDSDERKQGQYWRDDVNVFPPKYLKSSEYDYVVVAVSQYNSILNICRDLEISFDKIFVLCRDWENIDFIDYKLKTIFKLKQEIGKLKWEIEARWENAPYEFGLCKVPIVKSAEELLVKLISERKSLSRFGDGELELMRGKKRLWYQEVNYELAERLKEVFYSNREDVLIAVSDNFGSLASYTLNAANEIRAYLSGDTRTELMELLGTEREYFDAYVSRPYLMYRDKNHAVRIFALLKTLWNNRNILLVEGEYTRTGVRNDLFDNAESIRRILCPHTNAFDQYAEILECIEKNLEGDELVLLCLGPTATVLAYDISLMGVQAIDFGQIDNEYEWFLNKAEKRIAINGKAVYELDDSHTSGECLDSEYITQVIARI